jgi:hypothetical protein
MLTASLRRNSFLLVLIAFLATPWAASAKPNFENPRLGLFDLADTDLLARVRSFLGAWAKEGCHVDPDGRCIEKTPPTKEGCDIDPNGRPRCTP